MRTNLFVAALLLMAPMAGLAQSGTNSPYSQYGLGILSDQTSGFNRGMDGLGMAFHEGDQVNFINPASYSAMDSLTFIFDVGASGQITNFSENGHKVNAHNSDFEYAVAGFRVIPHLGMSFGILPFTNVGYDYSSTSRLSSSSTYTNTYHGSGGIHQVYVGAGWEPLPHFAIGANISYLWGDYSRSVVNSYSESGVRSLSRYYSGDVHLWKVDLGVQYTHKINKKDQLTVGVTYSPKPTRGADGLLQVVSSGTVADTARYELADAYKIPSAFGAGVMFNHDERLKAGLDVSLQKWGSLDYPVYSSQGDNGAYVLRGGIYKDRTKVTLGCEYTPDKNALGFLKRVRYRIGASYATPYYRVNGQDGPKEFSVSGGFGIPIMNSWNNRSVLNISGQWVRRAASGLLTENTFRINIGLTFNERWFAKWRVK